jgi:hypothetical protein
MATPTRTAANSLMKDGRIIWGSNYAGTSRVASVTSTTIVLSDATDYTNKSLYTLGAPGKVEILNCAAGTTHVGKTSNITGFSSSTVTVSDDFSAFLAAGDIVSVTPPLSVELFLNQGHSLNATLSNDYTMGLTDTFDTHNTPMGVDVAGDVPFFQTIASEGFLRFLGFVFGTYKSTVAGTHKFRPIEANDGTFTEMDDAVAYVQDGNGVIRRVFQGLFGTSLTLDFPENARAVGSISSLGVSAVREVGGSGKTFPSGVSATRSVADGVLNSTTTVTSATAAFVAGDVGSYITGTGIPAGATIASVTNGTTVIISVAATATASGVSLTITRYNWLRTNFTCDTGAGLTFRSAFVQLGGNFGDALDTSLVETTAKNVTIRIERGAMTDRVLGSATIVKPEEMQFTLTVSGTRLVQNDTIFEYSQGATTSADPASDAKTTTRMLIKAISPDDSTKTLTIDIPRGVFSSRTDERQRGRQTETFEYRMLATLDASTGCVSTTTPPVECTALSTVVKSLATQL